MKKIIAVIFQIFFLISCEKTSLTPEEFQKKHESEKVVITLNEIRFDRGASFYFGLELDGKKFEIMVHNCQLFFLQKGAKFFALVDKKNPEKNYLIFWDQPIKSSEDKFSVYTKVKSRYNTIYDYYIWVNYSFTNNGHKKKLCIASDPKYYDILKILKNKNIPLKIDYYPFVDDQLNTRYVAYIDYVYLDSLIIDQTNKETN